VLKRPVGSSGPFNEHAEMPRDIADGGAKKTDRKVGSGTSKKHAKKTVDEAADRKAAQAYDRERQRRELEEAKEEAARQKERERRQRAVNKAQATIDRAHRDHTKRSTALRTEIESIEGSSGRRCPLARGRGTVEGGIASRAKLGARDTPTVS
jgi:hypothetical protein